VNRRLSAWIDRNLRGAGGLRAALRHIFPDHWSFFLGECALYSFAILVVTGIFLAMFFRASGAEVVYEGSYAPLRGVRMSDAYASVLQLSFDVRAGLIMRQIHHWAAIIFAGAVALHLIRTFFTGAYRKPRRLNWLVGGALLLLVMANGFTGYSVPDDLLSGIGLRITYSVTESIPLIGPTLASWLFGGPFPAPEFIARLYPLHIFLVPALIAGLLAAHLGLLWRQYHTQKSGPGRTERRVVGTRMVPAYALRTLGFFFFIGGVLALLGGFFQINPVWLYGPYRAWDATVNAQPDWYMAWLEGGLRVFPGWDIQIGGFLIPAIFWPAVVLPGILFTLIFVWPWLDAAINHDPAFHNLLDRPSARPGRAALGAGAITMVSVLLLAGGNDVFITMFGGSQQTLLTVLQGQLLGLPPVVALLVYALCRRASSRRPAAGELADGSSRSRAAPFSREGSAR
jgi:ubiquinol-cytochrome c reductase cytochrome b subunit